MSRSTGHCIADSLQLCLGYAERLLQDIPEDKFARLAVPGGIAVQSNHAAFVIGHLAIYGPRIIEQLGGDASGVKLSRQLLDACSKDAQCQDDPEGTIYPSKAGISEAFFSGYRAALAALQQTPDETFQQPNPQEGRIAELFPTLGSLQAFYCGGHLMMHLGQLSAWRRMWGLPPA